LVDYAVKNCINGRLARSKKEKPPVRAARAASINARLAIWEAKKKRAENAIKKLKRQQNYYAKPVPKRQKRVAVSVSDDLKARLSQLDL
jgi:hypothetical protein